MALTDKTLDGVLNAMADWMVRPDLTPAQLKDCVAMFEAEANRQLQLPQMETTATLTTSSGAAALPSNYLAWRTLTWNGSSSQEVEYVHPSIFRAWFTTTEVGTPQWFTVEGSTINIRPVDDTASVFTLRYWQTVTGLTIGSSTNWLLTNHPDIYLAGCLYEAYKFVRDPDAAVAYKQLMEEGFQELYDLAQSGKEPAELRVVGTIV